MDNYESMIPNNDIGDPSKFITENFAMISELSKKTNEASKKASLAKNKANDVGELKAGAGHRTKTIQAMQGSAQDMAEAVVSISEAQQTSFQYTEKLAEYCNVLLMLGVKSTADCRRIVEDLALKVHGATEEELDQLARQEIQNVIFQLKQQLDIFEKIDKNEIYITELKGKASELEHNLKNTTKNLGLLNDDLTKKINSNHEEIKDNFVNLSNQYDSLLSLFEKNSKGFANYKLETGEVLKKFDSNQKTQENSISKLNSDLQNLTNDRNELSNQCYTLQSSYEQNSKSFEEFKSEIKDKLSKLEEKAGETSNYNYVDNGKTKIAYIVAGSSAVISIASIILQFVL